MKQKIVVIGCGLVGTSYAYSLINQKIKLDELVLIDIDNEKSLGVANDLSDCLSYLPSKINIKSGTYKDCSDASIVVITAGIKQKKNQKREELLLENANILRSIIPFVMESLFNGIFLIATNPVESMSYLTWKLSGLDHSKIIGSGTSLDTARLRYLLSKKLGFAVLNIHANVIGEHGDNPLIPWNYVTIGQDSINNYLKLEEQENIEKEVIDIPYQIINQKGATNYAIGICLVELTKAILEDKNQFFSVSNYDDNLNIFIGNIASINKDGIGTKISLPLTEKEQIKWENSVQQIKKQIIILKENSKIN